jgi:hypothetical protein
MKNVIIVMLMLLSVFSACKKSEDSTSEFSNKIELGTGTDPSNPFILTGVGTTFASTANIYFRLESQDDMGGSKVKIQVNRANGSLYNAWEFPNGQSYGHIMVSSFRIAETGNFIVTGILVTGSKTIASIAVVIN